MSGDYRDVVITELADSEAAALEQITVLIGVVADLAFENFVLHRMLERELVTRLHGEAVLDRERRRRNAQQRAAA